MKRFCSIALAFALTIAMSTAFAAPSYACTSQPKCKYIDASSNDGSPNEGNTLSSATACGEETCDY